MTSFVHDVLFLYITDRPMVLRIDRTPLFLRRASLFEFVEGFLKKVLDLIYGYCVLSFALEAALKTPC
jgi:hypothetical protein